MNLRRAIFCLVFLALTGCASDSIGEKKMTGVNVKNVSGEVIKLMRFWSSTFKSEFHPDGFLSLGSGSANGFIIVGASFPTDGTLTWVYRGVEYTKPVDTKPYGSPSALSLKIIVIGEQFYTCKEQAGCVCTSPTEPSYHKPPSKPEYKNCPLHGPY